MIRRESNEEGKGEINHLLLAGFPSPAQTAILGHVSGENNGFKCGQNFADLHSVGINRTEGLAAPESVLGAPGRSAQPLKPFDQFLCALLDISKESIMIGREGPFFGGFTVAPHTLDGTAQPGAAALFVSTEVHTAGSHESSCKSVVSQNTSLRKLADLSRAPLTSLLRDHTLPAPN